MTDEQECRAGRQGTGIAPRKWVWKELCLWRIRQWRRIGNLITCNGWGNAASHDFVVYFLYSLKWYTSLPGLLCLWWLLQCAWNSAEIFTKSRINMNCKHLVSSMIEKKGMICAVFSNLNSAPLRDKHDVTVLHSFGCLISTVIGWKFGHAWRRSAVSLEFPLIDCTLQWLNELFCWCRSVSRHWWAVGVTLLWAGITGDVEKWRSLSLKKENKLTTYWQ